MVKQIVKALAFCKQRVQEDSVSQPFLDGTITLLKRYRSTGSTASEPHGPRRRSFLRNWRIAGAIAATVAALTVGLW
ncbi:MAG: hypothetical protein KIT40_14155 [Nitrospira sp.]|nr:hypothetical protein [Nitrospira sp.]